MIHVFHGFLGSPYDFAFLKSPQVVLHDLYREPLPTLNENDVLIGYSLGGRLALDLAHKHSWKLKKIVLISAHPGLSTDQEKADRVLFEESVLINLKTKTKEEFLEWWNNLPIFSSDLPVHLDDERFKNSFKIFDSFRLSKQDNHLPSMISHKDKILYLAGSRDEKYKKIAEEILRPKGIPVRILAGGHRLFQQSLELEQVLKEEKVI